MMSNQKLKFDSDSDDPIDLYLIKFQLQKLEEKIKELNEEKKDNNENKIKDLEFEEDKELNALRFVVLLFFLVIFCVFVGFLDL